MSPFASLLFLVLLYVLGLYVSLFGSALSDAWKFFTLGFGLVISVAVFFSQFYSPLIRVREERRRFLIELLMSALSREHRKAHDGDFDTRTNVMLVSRRFRLFGNPKLQIAYTLGDFSEAELEQTYLPNVGCAGIALSERKQCLYDERDAKEPSESLSATQRQITAHIRSILSTPIHRASDSARMTVIGVLNIDSSQTATVAGFREVRVQLLSETYAEIIGSLI